MAKQRQNALCEVAGSKKVRKKKLAKKNLMRIMRVPRLSLSANRFFKKQIKQCVWALAERIGENQIYQRK
ncbi:hypothetical protein D0C16_11785 [Cellvibrio sp. KY-GH-1]|nr:hypothetical protein D0C16_11785 [Cellvibrio sp. KY-GH-1]